MREWFKARNVWGAVLQALPDDEAGKLAKAIWTYTMTGEITELEGASNGVFSMILMILQQDEEHDADVSRKRSLATAGIRNQKTSNGSEKDQMISNDIKSNQLISNDINCSNKNKSKNKEQEKEKEKEMILLFDRFYSEYPRHEDKQSALRAFKKINPDAELLDIMLSAIEKQKASAQWKDRQFIPLPSTWLNKHRWEDEVKTDAPVRVITTAQSYTQRDYSGEQEEAMRRMLEGVRA